MIMRSGRVDNVARAVGRPKRTGIPGVALGGVLAVTSITVPSPDFHVPDIQLTSVEDLSQVTIDIVRHGATTPPPPDFPSEVPGPPLCSVAPCGGGSPPDQTGIQQAEDVGRLLHEQLGPNVSGIFSGQSIRDIDTGSYFAGYYPDMQIQQLTGLNEAYSSFYLPQISLQDPGSLLFQLTLLLWAAGFPLAPMPGGVPASGVQLDQFFTAAVDTMYQWGVDHPVESDTGQITEVGFNNDASIFVWTLMNVKNPDLFYFIPAIMHQLSGSENQLLDFGGVVQFSGDPTDGWTLDSWNGTDIPAFPDPLTELFVLFRDLIVPPQAAVWDIVSAGLTGNPTTILDAIVGGVRQVVSAIVQFPTNLTDYINEAVSGGGSLASLGAELPTTGLAGLLPGELGSIVSDAAASF